MALRLDDLPFALGRESPKFGTTCERLIWNKRLDPTRTPDLIAFPSSAREVADAVRYAAGHKLKISPRGSGHHYEAAALRDGGLLLDLAGLGDIAIDDDTRTAWVGAGVTGGQLIERLSERGYAFPIGHCADVALSGYILAGGFGWNAGEWGSACANVSAVEMVTADGDIVVANERDHADLFWAARGGGPGFFAVITAYQLELRSLPPTAFARSLTFAAEAAPQLDDWLTSATATADRSVEVICLIGTHSTSGRPSVTVRALACGMDEEEARSKVASFSSPPKEAEQIAEPLEQGLAFAELTKFSAMPAGKRVAVDHLWSEAHPGDLLVAAHAFAAAPSSLSTINLVFFGGRGAAPGMPDGVGAALSVGGTAGAGIYAMWDEPADDEANRAWVRQVGDALSPFRSGRYVGEAATSSAPDRLAECFKPEVLDRLSVLRSRYDPKGLFFTWFGGHEAR